MKNEKIVTYGFLVLTLVAICCHARRKDKDWQHIKLRNSLPRRLEKFVNKPDCSRDTCTINTDCCSGYCARRYFYGWLGPYGYCLHFTGWHGRVVGRGK